MGTMIVAEPAVKDPAVVEVAHKKNRIQVSTNKKPLYFYVNLAKRYMQDYNEVELCALGMAIGTVVTVSEILKNNGFAREKKILTSTIGTTDGSNGRTVRKAKIEILLGKTENLKERKNLDNSDSNKEDESSE
ncbi:AlbA-like protein [Dioscorea alata]|uniref:AlbA-like protein n=1 Tax=Dioscorea alata TaxID=55571 RepID=A0ACB7TVP6_DIOAL|nr:AlbA-like protein [Dioscorea alata]